MLRPTRLVLSIATLLFSTIWAVAQMSQVGPVGQMGQATKVEETTASRLINRGNAEYRKAKYQTAIEYYSQVDRSAGELYARAIYNIGVCYFELYRTEESIAMYQRAIKLQHESYPNASYALGVALEDLKRIPDAKRAYQKAIAASEGKHSLAYFRLGVITGEKDPEAAVELFRKAIALSSDDLPAGHNNLGVMLARRGRFEEAQREFALAVRKARGQMPEAEHNLRLCSSLMRVRNNTAALTRFVIIQSKPRS